MAERTPPSYKNLVIYEIYVRNHGVHGTFADVEDDLPRIQSLGVDVVWLMPIHPIGQLHRKGTLGSPYSIRDFREVNTEYGTKEDFRRLIECAHALNLRVMLDVVFNHAACDSDLVREHPDWFHQGADQGPYRAWTDIIGFKHPNSDLTSYLIEILKHWIAFGIDGFRCDVAALLPRCFWLECRQQLAKVREDIVWLAESVNPRFVAAQRAAGMQALSDSELYEVFDLTYDYDLWPIWEATVAGKSPVRRYLEILRFQDCIYPTNYVKLRCVENHDSARIMALAPSPSQALAWTAFQGFNKGALLIYAGQESGATHSPSLFEIDKIEWRGYELQPFLANLVRVKKEPAQVAGQFVLVSAEPAIQAAWRYDQRNLYGVFNVSALAGNVDVPLPDGVYEELLQQKMVEVRDGRMSLPESASILRYHQDLDLKAFYSDLIDFERI